MQAHSLLRPWIALGVAVAATLVAAAASAQSQSPADSRTLSRDQVQSRGEGVLARTISDSLRHSAKPPSPADRAVERGNRPCTRAEEIEEMLSTPRPWLPPVPESHAGNDVPIMACYSRENPPTPEMIDFLETQLFNQLPQYNADARWTRTALNGPNVGSPGEPITLTWSFVPDGLDITSNGTGEGTQPSTLFATMDQQFAASGGRAMWIQRITESFQRWSQVSGNSYVRVTFGGNDWDDGAAWGQPGVQGRRGDVRISMKNLDGAGSVLAYDGFPNDSDMVMDSSDNWAVASNNHRTLRNVVMHEHGHGLGFNHTCPANQTKLMEPFLSLAYDGPQIDDVRGVHRNYGDVNEPDNTPELAGFFGSFGPGANFTLGAMPTVINGSVLSIDANGEEDWHRFTLTQPVLANATLTPVGGSYLDLDQSGDGSCPTMGTNINANAFADLRLEMLTSDQVAVATADVNFQGDPEVITGILLPAGTNYLRVSESNQPTQTQLYTIAFTTGSALSFTATNNVQANVRLTWSTIPGTGVRYFVFRNPVNDRASATMVTPVAGVTTTNFTDTTAVPGQSYFYWVAALQVTSFTIDFGGPIVGLRALPPNINPTANAGPDQLVQDADGSGFEPVTLNGSASSDPDGTIVNYRWTRLNNIVVADGAASSPAVSLPVGVHTITLTVTDNRGGTAVDTVVVTVNGRPIANAGPDQTLTDADRNGVEPVTLNGSGSSDPDGTIATYRWTEGPLTLANQAFALANVNLAVGVHTVTLTVTDNRGLTNSDTVVIAVNAPACRADFNGDLTVDPDDLADFITCYFSSPPCGQADFNADGSADPDDLADFISLFFQGC